MALFSAVIYAIPFLQLILGVTLLDIDANMLLLFVRRFDEDHSSHPGVAGTGFVCACADG